MDGRGNRHRGWRGGTVFWRQWVLRKLNTAAELPDLTLHSGRMKDDRGGVNRNGDSNQKQGP